MKVGIKAITKKVIDGTDSDFVTFSDFMFKKKPGGLVTQDYLEKVAQGALKYMQVLLYQGSQGVIENITGILNAPNEEEMRTILTQWKEMEEMTWEVIDEEPKD